MTKPSLILAAALLAQPLSACGGKKQDVQAQAGGEILPGSISDEMLPMDTATSKPPLAPKTAAPGGNAKDSKDGETAGEGPEAVGAVADARAAEPGE